MAGLLDDPTKKTNPVAGALVKMDAAAFGTGPVAPDKTSPLPQPNPTPTKELPVPDKVSPLPKPVPTPTKDLPVPDKVSPLPKPTPAPAPAPPPAPAPQATVEDRLNGILSADSDYIKRARAEGMAVSNRRGLLNSSMAAGAAQGAAIDRALPIAQQDADIAANERRLQMSIDAERARLEQAAGYDMERLQADHANNLIRDAAQAKNAQDLARVQGEINSALQAQGNTEQIQRMGVELHNQLRLQQEQLANDLQKIAASGDQDIRRLVEAGNQERITLQQSIEAQDRAQMTQAMVNIFQIEQQLRAALLSNDKISATERAAYERTITALGQPIRDFVNKLFGPQGGTGTTEAPPVIPTPVPPSTVYPDIGLGIDLGGLGGPIGSNTGVGTTGTSGSGDLITTGPGEAPIGNPTLPFLPQDAVAPVVPQASGLLPNIDLSALTPAQRAILAPYGVRA